VREGHTANESVSLSEVERAAEIYEQIAVRFSNAL
jgi:acetylornithine deacetylase/succinyl-diaminopimelate desuccinylase-like protein